MTAVSGIRNAGTVWNTAVLDQRRAQPWYERRKREQRTPAWVRYGWTDWHADAINRRHSLTDLRRFYTYVAAFMERQADELAEKDAQIDAQAESLALMAEEDLKQRQEIEALKAAGDPTIIEKLTHARQLITRASLALRMRELCEPGPIDEQVGKLCDLLIERSSTITILKAELDEYKQRAQAPTAQSKSVPTVEAGETRQSGLANEAIQGGAPLKSLRG